MKKNWPYLALMAALVGLDQASKALIEAKIGLHETIPVVRGFFNLTHLRNKGAILGVFNASGSRLVPLGLGLLAFAAMILVAVYFLRTPASQKLVRASFAFIIAGALGNLVDRVAHGYVVDFLEMHVKSFYWPTFNVADSCITIGAVLLIFVFFVRRQPA
ncbi:MAG: signal peptidase II [Candidatus Aminicenantes bacterium]|nr:signal peptidase II [Candidatus Aminicenantes bacterium]